MFRSHTVFIAKFSSESFLISGNQITRPWKPPELAAQVKLFRWRFRFPQPTLLYAQCYQTRVEVTWCGAHKSLKTNRAFSMKVLFSSFQDLVWSHNRKTGGDSKWWESEMKAQWTQTTIPPSSQYLSLILLFTWVQLYSFEFRKQSGQYGYGYEFGMSSIRLLLVVVWTVVSFISQLSARIQYGCWYWYLIPRRPPGFRLSNDHSKIAKINHCCWVCHNDRKTQQYQPIAVNRFNSSDGIWSPSTAEQQAGITNDLLNRWMNAFLQWI